MPTQYYFIQKLTFTKTFLTGGLKRCKVFLLGMADLTMLKHAFQKKQLQQTTLQIKYMRTANIVLPILSEHA